MEYYYSGKEKYIVNRDKYGLVSITRVPTEDDNKDYLLDNLPNLVRAAVIADRSLLIMIDYWNEKGYYDELKEAKRRGHHVKYKRLIDEEMEELESYRKVYIKRALEREHMTTEELQESARRAEEAKASKPDELNLWLINDKLELATRGVY